MGFFKNAGSGSAGSNGSLWRKSGDQAPHTRNPKHDEIIRQHRETVDRAEDARLEAQRGHRASGEGKLHRNMTPAEARAHGYVVSRGFFGGITVERKEAVQHRAQEAEDEARAAGKQVKTLTKALAKSRGNKAIAAQLAGAVARQRSARKTANALHRKARA